MENKGCHDCKYYTGKLNDNLQSIRICRLGYKEECDKWWAENGNRKHGDTLTLPSCNSHDYPESTKILDRMNKKVSNILKELKVINHENRF